MPKFLRHSRLYRPSVVELWIAVSALFCIQVVQPIRAENPHSTAIPGSVFSDHSSEAVAALFEEAILTRNTVAVCQRAAELREKDRFDFLKRWVLPQYDPATIRMSGSFTRGNNSLLPVGHDMVSESDDVRLTSPALDLLEAASRLDRMADFREQIKSIPAASDDLQRRSRAAMLALLYMHLDDNDNAEIAFQNLLKYVGTAELTDHYNHWPETLVAWTGAHEFADQQAVGDLLDMLYSQRTIRWLPRNIEGWHTQIDSLLARFRHIQSGGSHRSFDGALDSQEWIQAVRSTAHTRATGHARVHWNCDKQNEIVHLAGHQDDYLLYHQPLRGNFEVEFDISSQGATQAVFGGSFIGTHSDRTKIEVGDFRRRTTELISVSPEFGINTSWVRCRIVFNDGGRRVFLGGRLVEETTLPDGADPWIGIRSWWRNGGRLRDFRIEGTPSVPDSVSLISSTDLREWKSWFDDSVGHPSAQWHYVEGPEDSAGVGSTRGHIIGRGFPGAPIVHRESLLQYYRPLTEDGTIEYEYYYVPGQSVTHPAIGRLAFLMRPDGIRLHHVTDGKYDTSELDPDNAFNRPNERRGDSGLPLTPFAWNHVALTFLGDTLTIRLNGQPVYVRDLDSNNRRDFGLFHYADQSRAMVRSVVMKGDWPKTVPPVARQSLANQFVLPLDEGLANLSATTYHDFMKDGVRATDFYLPKPSPRTVVAVTNDGIQHSQTSGGDWAQSDLIRRCAIHGDFDLVAEFDGLQMGDNNYCGCGVAFVFADGFKLTINRRRQKNFYHQVAVAWDTPVANGESRSVYDTVTTELSAGRIRIARRDDTYFVMIAENDSPTFRLVGQKTIPGAGQQNAQVRLRVVAFEGGSTNVVWKNLLIRAEEIIETGVRS